MFALSFLLYRILSVFLLLRVSVVTASKLILDIHYPESSITLVPGSKNVFTFGYSTSPYSYSIYTERNNWIPWWGNRTYFVTTSDKVGANNWQKEVDLGNEFFGSEVYVNMASFVNQSIPAVTVNVCMKVLLMRDMGGIQKIKLLLYRTFNDISYNF